MIRHGAHLKAIKISHDLTSSALISPFKIYFDTLLMQSHTTIRVRQSGGVIVLCAVYLLIKCFKKCSSRLFEVCNGSRIEFTFERIF